MDEYPDSKYERDKIGDSYKSIQQGQLNIRARKVYALYKSEYALRHLYAKLNAILLGAINDIIVQHTEGRIAMLKIGCAFANFNVDARKYELNIVGTDIGEENCRLARKETDNKISIVQADAEALPFIQIALMLYLQKVFLRICEGNGFPGSSMHMGI